MDTVTCDSGNYLVYEDINAMCPKYLGTIRTVRDGYEVFVEQEIHRYGSGYRSLGIFHTVEAGRDAIRAALVR